MSSEQQITSEQKKLTLWESKFQACVEQAKLMAKVQKIPMILFWDQINRTFGCRPLTQLHPWDQYTTPIQLVFPEE